MKIARKKTRKASAMLPRAAAAVCTRGGGNWCVPLNGTGTACCRIKTCTDQHCLILCDKSAVAHQRLIPSAALLLCTPFPFLMPESEI